MLICSNRAKGGQPNKAYESATISAKVQRGFTDDLAIFVMCDRHVKHGLPYP